MATSTAGIYCEGAIYPGTKVYFKGWVEDLKSSGMQTLIVWSVHVQSNGDIHFNDSPLVSDGKYVGDNNWPAQLTAVKSGGSVNRILFSVGSGGVDDWGNIQTLMKTEIGLATLTQNFSALLKTIPVIDGIDYDDESLYDPDTTVKFSELLNKIGYKEITFCPYTSMKFWVSCLKTLQKSNPGLVTRFNLQCYSGGARNDPAEWITAIQTGLDISHDAAAAYVYPGLACRTGDGGDCPEDVISTLQGWQNEGEDLSGAWIWQYGALQSNKNSGLCEGPMDTTAYAKSIDAGLAG